jgi:hypothetical protein
MLKIYGRLLGNIKADNATGRTDMSSDKTEKSGDAKKTGFLEHAFKTGINAAEDIHKRAFDIPLTLLEGMGAPQDKVDMLRTKSQTMIGELYSAINSLASQVTPGASSSAAGSDSSAKEKPKPAKSA